MRRGDRLVELLKCALPSPPSPPLASSARSPTSDSSASVSPVSAERQAPAAAVAGAQVNLCVVEKLHGRKMRRAPADFNRMPRRRRRGAALLGGFGRLDRHVLATFGARPELHLARRFGKQRVI